MITACLSLYLSVYPSVYQLTIQIVRIDRYLSLPFSDRDRAARERIARLPLGVLVPDPAAADVRVESARAPHVRPLHQQGGSE